MLLVLVNRPSIILLNNQVKTVECDDARSVRILFGQYNRKLYSRALRRGWPGFELVAVVGWPIPLPYLPCSAVHTIAKGFR